MKKLLLYIFIFAVIITLLPAKHSFAAETRLIKVGAFDSFPLIFKDTDGDIKGFYVDLLTEVGAKENIRFEYVFGTWNDSLERIKSGKIDLLPGAGYLEERTTYIDYGKNPLLTIWGDLYVLDSTKINGILDVSGKKIGVAKGDIITKNFRELVSKFDMTCQFVELATYDDVFKAVAEKKVDAGIADVTYGNAKLAEFGLRSTGVVFNPLNYYFTATKGRNQDLLLLLDKYLAGWKNQKKSVLNQAKTKWLHGPSVTVEVIPRWLINALIIFGVAILVAFSFIVLLRLQVKKATNKVLQREDALRRSEEKFRLIFDASPVGIGITTMDGRLFDANTAALRMRGYNLEELQTISVSDSYVRPDDRDIMLKIFKETGVVCDHEVELKRKDGSSYWALLNMDKVRLDNQDVILSTHSDITEQRHAQEALMDSRSKFQFLSESMSDVVFTVDMNMATTYVSPSIERMLGFTPAERMIQKVDEQLTPKSQKLIFDLLLAELNREKEKDADPDRSSTMELEYYHKDGFIKYLSTYIRGIRDTEGNLIGFYGSHHDVTDRKRVEQELRKSEEKYRLIFENSPMGVLYFDEKGVIVDCNNNFVKIIGSLQQSLIGLNMLNLPDKNIASNVQKALNGSTGMYEGVYNSVTAKKVTPTRVLFTPMKSEDGRILGGVGIIEDITERKQMEDSLRESEIKLQAIFDTVGTGILIIDKETQIIIEANPTAIEMTGLPRESIIGNICHSLVCPAQAGKCPVKDLGQNVDHSERKLVCAEGHQKDILKTVYPITIKGRDCYIESFTNITDRKQAEDRLQKRERQMADIIEFLPDATLAINKERRVIIWNKAIEEMTGVPAAEMIGKGDYAYTIPFYGEARPQLMDLVFDDQNEIAAKYPKVTREGDTLMVEVFCHSLYNNKGAWVSANASPLHDQSGNIIGAIESIRDITSRKQAEEEKRDLQERLNRAEKMEALGTLAGGVAHDLNNILGIVVGYSEMILDEVDETSPLRRILVNVFDSGQKAAAVVDDMLAMARRGVPVSNILTLNKIIADFQKSPELKNLSFHHPDVKIQTNLDSDLLNISGSSVHLSKSLYNLISNASEAMSKGGILTIKTTNQYLDKPMSGYNEIREGDYVVLSVSDTGEGISEKDMKRIFEPFYTKKIMGRSGTGLGLAIVWGMVTDHNGYINVQSEEGKGSTFTLYFPVTREEIPDEAVAIDVSAYMGNGQSILIVDDVSIQRELATDMLKKLNYNVDSVKSGEEAIIYLKDHQPDLIILDMIMDPGMDGLDTYKSILKTNPKQKTIIVSGFSESDRVKEAKRLGAGTYVRKPYIKEKLGMAVKKELDKK